MKTKFIIFSITFLLVLSGCNTQKISPPSSTLEAITITPILNSTPKSIFTESQGTSTATPWPSFTPTLEPFTSSPTPKFDLQPVGATCVINSKVRSWPGKGGEDLGGLMFGTQIKVLARNASGMWFYINFDSSPTGTGWVLSSAVKLKGYIDLLPIALEGNDHQITFIQPNLWTVFGTPLPLPTLSIAPASKSATVTQNADIRVCPTTSCMIIAYLKTGDQIILTGREGQNEWAQFLYPSGRNGIGWVSRISISPDPDAFSNLPYYDELGNLITPEPPSSTPDPRISPTPTRTATATPAGPLAEITSSTTVFSLQSSFSPELGTLQPGDKIHITRESLNGIWFEIQYPANSTGRGYISTKYVRKLGDFRYMYYTDSNGTPVPTP